MLNEVGITTTAGNKWGASTLRRVVMWAGIAGQSEHNGNVYGAVWPAIITPEQRSALLGELKVRYPKDRRLSYSYLLTGGVAVCGICDTALVARPRSGGTACHFSPFDRRLRWRRGRSSARRSTACR